MSSIFPEPMVILTMFEAVPEGKYFVHNDTLYVKKNCHQAWCNSTQRFSNFNATTRVRYEDSEKEIKIVASENPHYYL